MTRSIIPEFVRFRPIADIGAIRNKRGMNVTIFDGTLPVGYAYLSALDPPTGCAAGTFVATAGYRASAHANVLDGEYLGDRGAGLRVFSHTHGEIECRSAAIFDFPILDEIRVEVIGIPYPLYETLFADYAGYRSYRGLDPA